jgi:hypothetical protein
MYLCTIGHVELRAFSQTTAGSYAIGADHLKAVTKTNTEVTSRKKKECNAGRTSTPTNGHDAYKSFASTIAAKA